MRAEVAGVLLLLLTGCSSDPKNAGPSGGGSGAAQAGGGTTHGPNGAGAPGEGATANGGGTGGGAANDSPRVPLPEGSREFDGIVNLIDAQAAQELDEFLALGNAGLTQSLNLFLTYYEERYDFVFLFTDHARPDGSAAGRFLSVTSQPHVGTGDESQYLAPGYQTNGRVKGAMAVAHGSGPFSHEIAHYWGVFLDSSFGFGVGKDYNSPAHWGYAGVNGTLGGFDPQTLSCQTPAGAPPQDCQAMVDGRYRYVVHSFNPGGNGLPYAPLELYLLGLASAEEVPAEFPVLLDAATVPNSADPQTGAITVEAAGLATVKMSDITARHGVATQLAPSARQFSAAFVVVSSAPAADEVLAEVALRAAAFGDRGTHPITRSFAFDTGNRATMDTVLGPRRATSDPPPAPRPAFECDVLSQNCEDGLACYGSYCAIPGKIEANAACARATDCAAGSRCMQLANQQGGYCARYCDRTDPQSPLACASVCTSVINLVDANQQIEATVCGPQ